jgi:deazaflavin-dependent oxidoreductase (nitroreductase family)
MSASSRPAPVAVLHETEALTGSGRQPLQWRKLVPDRNDWNRQTVEAFRANKGQVGGTWEGRPLLLLTTTGAKSGQRRTNPTMYLREGDRQFVFASRGGGPTNPDWYHNLLAHPEVTVEIGDQTYPAIAKPMTGEEHDSIYAR